MMSFGIISLVVLAGLAAPINGLVPGSKIKSIADKYVDSTKWAYAKYHSLLFRWGTNKCNAFVADVLKEAGASVPQRHGYWSPIGAREWGNPTSTYLTGNKCYKQVRSRPQDGDIIAGQGHVGIVTGPRTTTSAAEFKVLKNDWGYRSNNSGIIFWRYIC